MLCISFDLSHTFVFQLAVMLGARSVEVVRFWVREFYFNWFAVAAQGMFLKQASKSVAPVRGWMFRNAEMCPFSIKRASWFWATLKVQCLEQVEFTYS